MTTIPTQRTPAEFLAEALDARESRQLSVPGRTVEAGTTAPVHTNREEATMTTTTTATGKLQIEEFTIDRPVGEYPADILVWRGAANADSAERAHDHCEDYGRILVRLSLDGQFDVVEAYTVRTSDIEALDRAIVAMQEVRDRLVTLGHDAGGDCMATGDGGRCKLPTGHDGPHKFPILARQLMEQAERKATA